MDWVETKTGHKRKTHEEVNAALTDRRLAE
jgi:hypothetical protein